MSATIEMTRPTRKHRVAKEILHLFVVVVVYVVLAALIPFSNCRWFIIAVFVCVEDVIV